LYPPAPGNHTQSASSAAAAAGSAKFERLEAKIAAMELKMEAMNTPEGKAKAAPSSSEPFALSILVCGEAGDGERAYLPTR
jgi:hypothetical protein